MSFRSSEGEDRVPVSTPLTIYQILKPSNAISKALPVFLNILPDALLNSHCHDDYHTLKQVNLSDQVGSALRAKLETQTIGQVLATLVEVRDEYVTNQLQELECVVADVQRALAHSPNCAVFPSVDQVSKLTVFNIGGNKVRLIAAVHYNRKKVYIRAVLTHPLASLMEVLSVLIENYEAVYVPELTAE